MCKIAILKCMFRDLGIRTLMTTERGETPKSGVALAEVNCADGPWVIWNTWTLVSFQTPLLRESFLAKDAQLAKQSSFLKKVKN